MSDTQEMMIFRQEMSSSISEEFKKHFGSGIFLVTNSLYRTELYLMETQYTHAASIFVDCESDGMYVYCPLESANVMGNAMDYYNRCIQYSDQNCMKQIVNAICDWIEWYFSGILAQWASSGQIRHVMQCVKKAKS